MRPAERPQRVFDGEGLYIEIRPNGGKWWRFKYRCEGKEKLLSFGSYPEVPLSLARTRRADARQLVAAGTDPSVARKQARDTKQREALSTVEAVARAWLAHRAPGWTAGRVFQRLRSIYRYALSEDLVEVDPTYPLKPSEMFKPRCVSHRLALDETDMPSFFRKLDAYEGDPSTRAALELLILTAVRPGELRGARWKEINSPMSLWRIPAERMKMASEHVVPLSTQALSVLKDMKATSGGSEFVFPTPFYPGKPLSDGTLNSALARLGYKGVATAPGFRTLFSTCANESGWNSDAIEKQLAHEQRDEVRGAYNRAQWMTERTKLMQWWGDRHKRNPAERRAAVARQLEREGLHQRGCQRPAQAGARGVANPAAIEPNRPKVERDVDDDLGGDQRRHLARDRQAPGGGEVDQQRESRQPVQRLQGVEGLDRQHRGPEPTEPPIANHRAVPILGLQEAPEPATPLTQESADGYGALVKARAVYATIEAVETFVDRHYAEQIEAIDRHDPASLRPPLQTSRAVLETCRADEVAHRDEAAALFAMAGQPSTAAMRVWLWSVGAGSRAAVKICRWV